jgi:glycosyltransferase involved in cell wall biosynthesis
MKALSIGIPTYNRKEQLFSQLQSLFKQDLSNIEEIVIIDNHSDYDVHTVINKFDTAKIRLIINPFNIKMATNELSPFLYCNTEWLWLLSDDDETLENSVENICAAIDDCPPDTGMIKFSVGREGSIQKDMIVKDLNEYIDYYYNEKNIRRGDFNFISTNVYNIKNLKDYLGFGFEFSYTYTGYLIPTIMGLNDKKISVTFSSKPIVKYIPPREGWYSFGIVGKGLSTFSHLSLNLTKDYRKKFLNCTMLYPPRYLMKEYVNKYRITSIQDFRIIYNNSYRYYLPVKEKFILRLFLLTMSNKTLEKFVIFLFRQIKKISQSFKSV